MGGLDIDLNDGGEQDLTVHIDVPPKELGEPRLDVTSPGLPAPLKTSSGFTVTRDDAGHMPLTFDTTLTEIVRDPDAPAKKPSQGLSVKGTLEIDCPPKK
jgi:hypothetical protein